MENQAHSTVFRVEGMDCAEELQVIENKLRPLRGVIDLEANFLERTLTVTHEPDLPPERIRDAIRRTGFDALIPGQEARWQSWWARRGKLLLTALSGALLAAGGILTLAAERSATADALLLGAAAAGGVLVARNGLRSALRLNLDINFLMTVAAAGAVGLGEYVEAASVVFLFSLAQLLETHSIDRARNAIRALLNLTPKEALVLRDGQLRRVPAAAVAVGESVVIRPGERIPLDGIVTEGASDVDESPITGESMPAAKAVGDSVFAGTINQHGSLTIRSTRAAGDTTLAKIIHMVEVAQSKRALAQRFVDRFSRIYTPTVLAIAVAIAVVPALLFAQPFDRWFYQALVLLVIACPCSLVISTPVTIVCALARSAHSGVLIKGGAHLENVGRLDTIIFDKTGTLTLGKPEVIGVLPLNNLPAAEILRIAAAVEARSEHHLARAIVRKAKAEGVHHNAAAGFAALPGRGAKAELDGRTCYVGSLRLFRELGCDTAPVEEALLRRESEGKAVVLVGTRDGILGSVVLSDVIRPDAADALRKLRRLGITDFIMLTGDNEGTARAIARQLGMDHYHAGLLPEDKVREVQQTLDERKLAAMVGDGVNDAPALATSSVGIAMGTAGTDAALETADIALMADDLEKLPYTVSLGRTAVAVIRQNIAFSLLIKVAFIGLALAGVASLWAAVAADMGGSLLVIFNGMRLLQFKEGS